MMEEEGVPVALVQRGSLLKVLCDKISTTGTGAGHPQLT